jgi:tyrosyl-tRNA synthetase
MTFPLLVGLDGVEKMSKSKGNYIGVTEPPKEMFGKVMSIPDSLMGNYFALLAHTFARPADRKEIEELLDPARTHPRRAKATLGRLIVETYHGPQAAEEAEREFDRVFSRKQTPAEMPEIRVAASRMNVVELVCQAGFAKSRSEARRLVEQKAVSLDGAEIAEVDAQVDLKAGQVLRVGKRRFGRIVLS